MNRTEPVACSLGSGELVDRRGAWRDVASHALSRDVGIDRIVSVYPSDNALLNRLRELIAAEGQCCEFLRFTVTEGPTETVVELTFPPEARALVEGLLPEAAGTRPTRPRHLAPHLVGPH